MTKTIDWSAAADRIECIVECLTAESKFPVAGPPAALDHRVAALVVEYCRKRAAGAPEDATAEAEIDHFLGAHGQSLDWVFRGDPVNMIRNLAEGTSSRRPRSAGSVIIGVPAWAPNGEIDKATALDELGAMAVDLWPPPWARQMSELEHFRRSAALMKMWPEACRRAGVPALEFPREIIEEWQKETGSKRPS